MNNKLEEEILKILMRYVVPIVKPDSTTLDYREGVSQLSDFIRAVVKEEKTALLKRIDRIMTKRWKDTDIEGEYRGLTTLRAKLADLERDSKK